MRTYFEQNVPSVPVRSEPRGIERVEVGARITPAEAGAIRSLARGRRTGRAKRRATDVLRRHGFRGTGTPGASPTPVERLRERLAQDGVIGAHGSARRGTVVTKITRTGSGFRGKAVVVAEQPGGPRGERAVKCKPGYKPTWNPQFKSWFCGNTKPLRSR